MPCQSVTANYSFKYAASSVDVFGANATNRIISMNSTIGLGSESSNLNFTIVGEPGGNQYLSAEQSDLRQSHVLSSQQEQGWLLLLLQPPQ